ncbi:penicillin-Binding protein (plasmid) [Arthrobacter sp. Hiyo8]|nr:penicillin-Binding protein [Arthrobacter sp. Hiyo8]
MNPDVAKATTNVLQDVLTKGSGLLIPQKLGVPDAAKTGTNQYNNQTWVLGYTKGLATASFFGDPFNGSAARLGRNITVNGKYYPLVDGAYIAGPQWAQYMQQVVGLYDHGDFDAPPQNLIGAPLHKPAAATRPPAGRVRARHRNRRLPSPRQPGRNPATGTERADDPSLPSIHLA